MEVRWCLAFEKVSGEGEFEVAADALAVGPKCGFVTGAGSYTAEEGSETI